VGGVVIAVGAAAVVAALVQSGGGDGTRHVDDPAGISYDVPEGWTPRSAPPQVVLERDGVRAATITHGDDRGDGAAAQLADDPSCDVDPTEADPMTGAEDVARCQNDRNDLPPVVLGAVAKGQFWVITLESAPADQLEQFAGSIELKALDTSAG